MSITRKFMWILVGATLAWPALIGGWAGAQDWDRSEDGYAAGGLIGIFIVGWVLFGTPALVMALRQRNLIAVALVTLGPITALVAAAFLTGVIA